MRILVAGGAGFIGSNFIHLVLRERPDFSVVNFDALTYAGNLENLSSVEKNPRYSFVQGDIADFAAVRKLCEEHKIDAIVNFAAETHVDRSIHGDPLIFGRTNVLGVQSLLQVVKELAIPRMVHVSTDEVYGALAHDSGESFTEATPFAPNSPYASSKASGDLMCRGYFKTYGVPVIVTHAANNYGPYQFPEKLIPYLITKAMKGEPLPLYGDGKYIRDWLHVEDHCIGILAVLERGRVGEAYNIGGDVELENIVIAKLMLKQFGLPESLIQFVADRPGHDRRYSINSSKIKKELAWKPVYDRARFEEGLKNTIEWYQTHQDWVKRAVDKSKDINSHIVVK